MSDTAESLHRKINSAAELQSVVRTMKALAASGISQYERAVQSLDDYYRTVELGLIACLHDDEQVATGRLDLNRGATVVVFGSDQGMVGQFNEVLTDFVLDRLNVMPSGKRILAVGDRLLDYLPDAVVTGNVPNSIAAITQLVGRVLLAIDTQYEKGEISSVYLFHNRPGGGGGYKPVMQRLLPLDKSWQEQFSGQPWPTANLPQVINTSTWQALVREYLFISLFRACAESLASENASRLAAMQRAEKNVEEQLVELNQDFNQLRQSGIDEELFDVIAGFEAAWVQV
jgi:F-type H+-transporting ATPase subunit gamma